MLNKPSEILKEYKSGYDFKASLGSKGMFEQNKINERFFIGDQWHGAKCGNDRPLVRHNVIKRIGNYKISQVLSAPISVSYSAEGVPTVASEFKGNNLGSDLSFNEINNILDAFSNYRKVTAERVKFSDLTERVLRNSYISGSSVLYTYWNPNVITGLYADSSRKVGINGDICCEVLDIEDIVFGDPYCENIENQPYIIIASRKPTEEVIAEARLNEGDIETLKIISESSENGKTTLYTKLYKEYTKGEGYTIKCTKVTDRCVVREEFDTRLRLYPLAIFHWERKNNSAYGESEITYLIPNQIAINRMITANVWSTMTTGMPIMVVNGDTVTQKITNDPGQIVKIYGSNEDVAGAVKYISPPSFTKDFDASITSLIENTLTQSGANEVALGDSRADNATALFAMRDASLMPLQIIKNRFYSFVEDVARIWVDFWIVYYGKRSLKLKDKDGSRYIEFDGNRYKNLVLNATVDISPASSYTERERADMLMLLYEKGAISKEELLCRLPEGLVPDAATLIKEKDLEEA